MLLFCHKLVICAYMIHFANFCVHLLLSSLGHPSSKIGDYIGPLICFAGFIPALTLLSVIFSQENTEISTRDALDIFRGIIVRGNINLYTAIIALAPHLWCQACLGLFSLSYEPL